ncbi:MutS domain V protein [Phocaeicola plebeius DSM 17135]|uniref:MutS domain V protein n=1 Tax=Phocaeicola plebeius (strain DSM 17135 / JCM 12973 / CCUG 54634 / M2) TaxID=484018 RepID=B5D3V1_PHOPM|nr:MutS family DNA mismatch repair protein [Phocaeicola plebeius]EDY94251.1 MutS domain V protein [Phocaeicola plebeius DSM 17135]
MNPENHYTERLSLTKGQLQQVKKQIFRISMLRLALFVAGVAGIYFFFSQTPLLIICICLTFLPLFILVKIHNHFFIRKEWLETQARIIQEELQALSGDYSSFEDGKEYVNPEHPYSFDLDIFGRRSLFQSINRTCTFFGKDRLAKWLQNHLHKKTSIEKRQEMVREISEHTLFREQFRVAGLVHHGQSSDAEKIQAWSQSPAQYLHAGWVKAFIWGVPVINSLLLITSLIGWTSFSCLGLSFGIFLVLSFGIIKRATYIQETYGKQLKSLNGYARLIALAKAEDWKSADMLELMERFNLNGQSPVQALQQLSKELDRLDLRNNQFLYVLLEGSIFFQLQEIVRIERWKVRYGQYISEWLETVGELDALCSLGTFAYNHPQYTYPELTEKPFCFLATQMGHPLMPASQCVKNDATIPSRPFFLIITGANMAGKSTYLRTIGVNYLLACVGAPVCCEKLKLHPNQLITSLRTSDSLSDNESYFFAELKRLKRIIDLLNQGQQLFIILDEILKGTNSMDKQKGSFDLIRQFMQLKANGIIATHDLLLGSLIKQFPEEIRNYCFEADIKDNELTFSYKLREGVAQNMNACFLMKKMGIILQE